MCVCVCVFVYDTLMNSKYYLLNSHFLHKFYIYVIYLVFKYEYYLVGGSVLNKGVSTYIGAWLPGGACREASVSDTR